METQASVTDWCRRYFPQYQNTKLLAGEVLGEALELAFAVGMTPEEMSALVIEKITKLKLHGMSEPAPGEAADVEINLLNLFEHLGLDRQVEVDKKMQINRSQHGG